MLSRLEEKNKKRVGCHSNSRVKQNNWEERKKGLFY